MYPNLKLLIFKLGIHQNQLAREVEINETILSKIINGYREPSATQRKLLSSYLNVDESWLFEKFDGRPRRAPLVPMTPDTEEKDGHV